MAAMIPGARFVQLEGNIHLPFFGNVDSIGRTMAEFLGDPVDVTPSKQGKTG
jgi:hypothetical protein